MLSAVSRSFWLSFEPSFMVWLQGLLGSFGTAVASFFTMFGEELVIVGMLGFLYWAYDKEFGLFVGTNIVVGLVWNAQLKNIVLRRRPYFDHADIKCLKPVDGDADLYDITAQGYSFPSGHSSNAASAYPSLFAWRRKKWLLVIAVVLPLLVGLSRVCLGVHYPTDVLAGWGLGLLTVLLVGWLQRVVRQKWILYAALLATAAVGCLWCRTTDYFSSLGLMIGFFAAALFEERYVQFANTRCVPRMILRVLVGCGLFLGLNTLLKLPFDPAFLASATAGSFAVRTVRYAISSFCVMGLYPLCFRLLDPLWHKLCPHAKHTPAQSGATDTAGQKDSEKTDPGAADDTPTAPV